MACQAPLSMGFSRQEYGSGLPFPSPGDLPNPGIDPGFPTLQADSLTSEPPGKPLWRIVSLLNTFCGPVLHIGSAAVYKYVTRVPRDYTLDEETQKWSSKRIITFWVMKH